MDKQTLGLLSLLFATMGFVWYVVAIVRHRTKPHVFSWVIWSLVVTVAFFAQTSEGAGAGAWVAGYSAILYFILALLSLRHGERNITRNDKIAFAAALTAIPVWYVTRDAFWAVVIATAIDTVAYYPTFAKAYQKPHEESPVIHIMDLLKCFPAILAVNHYSAATLMYPIAMIIADGTLSVMILWRRRKSHSDNT